MEAAKYEVTWLCFQLPMAPNRHCLGQVMLNRECCDSLRRVFCLSGFLPCLCSLGGQLGRSARSEYSRNRSWPIFAVRPDSTSVYFGVASIGRRDNALVSRPGVVTMKQIGTRIICVRALPPHLCLPAYRDTASYLADLAPQVRTCS